MRKFLRTPSPAMIVAVVALVFATTGSAAAVISFARNAGAVDGKSAVSAGASNGYAAGKLVATRRLGGAAGTIPAQYLDPGVARERVFGRNADVIDNGQETPFVIATIPGFGTVTATCADENNTQGVEDPRTTIAFGNTSGQTIEFARATGSGGGAGVGATILANNQSANFTIAGSNLFTLNIQKLGTNLIVEGVVRQNGRGTSAASCINYGRVSQVG
ncbi:MAG TPA: hypothetical protein VNB64_07260 [Solirubrobacteraceae bacterium]|nr:hypothetical protein [Solirubrobacteraceae bacterium]